MPKLHIAIGQYEFVEVEVTDPLQAREVYEDYKAAFQNGEGLDTSKWAKLRNKYMATGILNPDDQEQLQYLSKGQRYALNQIKLGLHQDLLKDIKE